jgi:hypothetical protein
MRATKTVLRFDAIGPHGSVRFQPKFPLAPVERQFCTLLLLASILSLSMSERADGLGYQAERPGHRHSHWKFHRRSVDFHIALGRDAGMH